MTTQINWSPLDEDDEDWYDLTGKATFVINVDIMRDEEDNTWTIKLNNGMIANNFNTRDEAKEWMNKHINEDMLHV
jgi:hypothetical protein